MTTDDLQYKSREFLFWEQIEKEARAELEKAEEQYFKITTFQEAVINLAKIKQDEHS